MCSVKQQPVAQMGTSLLRIITRTNSSRTMQTMPPVRNFSPPLTSSTDIRNCHISVVLSSTRLSTSSIRSVFTSVLFVCLCAPDVFLLISVRLFCSRSRLHVQGVLCPYHHCQISLSCLFFSPSVQWIQARIWLPHRI